MNRRSNSRLLAGLGTWPWALLLAAAICGSLARIAPADEPMVVQELTPLADSLAKKPGTPTTRAPVSAAKPAASDATISPATLDAVKQATVFIRTKRDQSSASGSGFVISTSGGRTIVATNHHVVGWTPSEKPDPSKGPARPITPRSLAAELKGADIEVVFHSGTSSEEVKKAEVLAADPSTDLCLLQIKGMQDPPKPIDFVHMPELYETMPLYTFGFPFGDALATSQGNPAITVGRASVSSLRLDAKGKLALVQIDGAINPGNSGGPLVAADGKLVGVAVATIRASGIGLAIPAEALPPLAQGLGGPTYLALVRQSDGKLSLRVECWVVDPMSRVSSVALQYRLVDGSAANVEANSALEKLPDCRKIELTMDKHFAYGEVSLGPDSTGKKLQTQTVVVNAAGPKLSDIATYEVKPPPAPVARARIVVRMPRNRHGKARVYIVGGAPAAAPPPQHQAPHEQATGNETAIIGGGGEARFEDIGTDGALLVGFDVGLGDDIRADRVRAIRGIFRQGGKRVVSPWHGRETERFVRVEARPGYAVGGITVKSGFGIEGLGATFMRIDGNKLSRRDSYESDWMGGYGGGDPQYLHSNERPIVGLIGRENFDACIGIGLALLPTTPAGKITPPQRASMPRSSKGVANRSVLVGNRGVARYEDSAPDGSVLVGLELGLIPFFNKELIRSITPIYRDGDKEPTLGEQHGSGVEVKRVVQLMAKPGYAIGAVSVNESNSDGIKVTFMRIDRDQLDPRDSYETETIGEQRPEGWIELSGEGHPAVGIIGASDERNNLGFGLLYTRPTSTGWEELP